MEDGHSKTVEQSLTFFGTDAERGLSLDQIKANQKKYGPNGKYLIKSFKSKLVFLILNKFLIYISSFLLLFFLELPTEEGVLILCDIYDRCFIKYNLNTFKLQEKVFGS